MSKDRRTIRLHTVENVQKAIKGIQVVAQHHLEQGWLMILTRKRTDRQNNRMWAIIAEILKQKPIWCDRRMDDDSYKIMFVHGLRKEARFIPTMDGEGVIPVTYSSSDLTVSEFNDLFALIEAWCAENGVDISKFDEPQERKDAA